MSETPLPNVCGCSMPLSICLMHHHGRQSLQQLAEFVLVPHPSSFNTVMGTGRGVCVFVCLEHLRDYSPTTTLGHIKEPQVASGAHELFRRESPYQGQRAHVMGWWRCWGGSQGCHLCLSVSTARRITSRKRSCSS